MNPRIYFQGFEQFAGDVVGDKMATPGMFPSRALIVRVRDFESGVLRLGDS